MIKMERC